MWDDFEDQMPNTQETKAKINKWSFIKAKSFCPTEETIGRVGRQPTAWEKTFTS